jgi:AraC-like DNA-binding protein
MNQVPGKPRGVLRPHAAQGEFRHERLLPAPALSDLVEHYWFVQWDLRGTAPHLQATLPHPNVHLVVERGEARIYGVHTDRFERTLEGSDFAFGIKFKPAGFHPFLQAPVADLANRSLPAWGAFADLGAACLEELPALAERHLLAALPNPDANVARMNGIVAAIADDISLTSVDQLVELAGMDKRTLQRLFQKYVGISPKWIIKRYRLHEAIARVQEGAVANWSALALDLGYFDQAHFIRDFRALVGQTPAGYASSLRTSAY